MKIAIAILSLLLAGCSLFAPLVFVCEEGQIVRQGQEPKPAWRCMEDRD